VETRTNEAPWQGLEELRAPLRSLVARHCRDENVLDDVVQETYLRAARYRERDVGVRHLRSWMARIALNVLSDHKRRGARFAVAEDDVLEDVPDPRGEEPEPPVFRVGRRWIERDVVTAHLRASLGELREEERAVLTSFYGGSGRCRDTARECSIPAHLVKVRLFRARRRLLRLLRRRVALAGTVAAELEGVA